MVLDRTMPEGEASATPPAPAPAKARVPRAQKPDHPAFPRGDTAKLQPVAHAFFADERRRSVGAALRGGVHRTVCCADALAWLRDRRLPRRCHVVCSPPDIGELKPISVADYTAWFVEAVRTVLGYLVRVRDHPRDAAKRKICLWEPAFRDPLATVDGGLQRWVWKTN